MILTQVLGTVSDFPHLHDDAMVFLQQNDSVCRNHTHQAVDLIIQSGVAVVVHPARQMIHLVELIQIKSRKHVTFFYSTVGEIRYHCNTLYFALLQTNLQK